MLRTAQRLGNNRLDVCQGQKASRVTAAFVTGRARGKQRGLRKARWVQIPLWMQCGSPWRQVSKEVPGADSHFKREKSDCPVVMDVGVARVGMGGQVRGYCSCLGRKGWWLGLGR